MGKKFYSWKNVPEKPLFFPQSHKARYWTFVSLLIFLLILLCIQPWRLTFSSARSDALLRHFARNTDGFTTASMDLISSRRYQNIELELWEISTDQDAYYYLTAWKRAPFELWYYLDIVGNSTSGTGVISLTELSETDRSMRFIFSYGASKFYVNISSADLSTAHISQSFRLSPSHRAQITPEP